jgi:NADH-quinone oxidoreductase subunit F
MDDRSCPVGVQLSLQEFFARESCGWCTPCREGLPWVARCLRAIEQGDGTEEDLEVLDMHVEHIRLGNTFCALAPGAMFPLESALRFWRKDFEAHIHQKRCPWKAS